MVRRIGAEDGSGLCCLVGVVLIDGSSTRCRCEDLICLVKPTVLLDEQRAR